MSCGEARTLLAQAFKLVRGDPLCDVTCDRSLAEWQRTLEENRLQALMGLLMVALYRSARQADALDVFARARRRLSSELGLEPGEQLARLHAPMLELERFSLPGEQELALLRILIADIVTQAVVDHLEPVDIQEQDGADQTPHSALMRQGLADHALKRTSVELVLDQEGP